MFEKAKPRRDAFRFSLSGMNTISSFTISPAIADDRINKTLNERLRPSRQNQPTTPAENRFSWGRFWLRRRRQAVQEGV